jgi:hypothetical protein
MDIVNYTIVELFLSTLSEKGFVFVRQRGKRLLGKNEQPIPVQEAISYLLTSQNGSDRPTLGAIKGSVLLISTRPYFFSVLYLIMNERVFLYVSSRRREVVTYFF